MIPIPDPFLIQALVEYDQGRETMVPGVANLAPHARGVQAAVNHGKTLGILAAVKALGMTGDEAKQFIDKLNAVDIDPANAKDDLDTTLSTPGLLSRAGLDAALGRTAMRFVDRAGDVHPGIDDADTICAEFSSAMSILLEKHRPAR
jgi:hypothetical protein